MVAAGKSDTLKEASPKPVTFNHGVEGSSPSALTKRKPLSRSHFSQLPENPSSHKSSMGRLWDDKENGSQRGPLSGLP